MKTVFVGGAMDGETHEYLGGIKVINPLVREDGFWNEVYEYDYATATDEQITARWSQDFFVETHEEAAFKAAARILEDVR